MVGIRLIDFRVKSGDEIHHIAPGENAFANNPTYEFPGAWWLSKSPSMIQKLAILSDKSIYKNHPAPTGISPPNLVTQNTMIDHRNHISINRSFKYNTIYQTRITTSMGAGEVPDQFNARHLHYTLIYPIYDNGTHRTATSAGVTETWTMNADLESYFYWRDS